MSNLKRKLSTWSIVFFTEIMIYSVKLINHILTFLEKWGQIFWLSNPNNVTMLKTEKGMMGFYKITSLFSTFHK